MAWRKTLQKVFHSVFRYVLGFFSSNLELICPCEFFKKMTLHSTKRLVQINSKFNSKPYDYLYMHTATTYKHNPRHLRLWHDHWNLFRSL